MTTINVRDLSVGDKIYHPFTTDKDSRALTIENIELVRKENYQKHLVNNFQQFEATWISPTGRKYRYYFALPLYYELTLAHGTEKVKPGESHKVHAQSAFAAFTEGYGQGLKDGKALEQEQTKKEYWRGVNTGKIAAGQDKDEAYERGFKSGLKENAAKSYDSGYREALEDIKAWINTELDDD